MSSRSRQPRGKEVVPPRWAELALYREPRRLQPPPSSGALGEGADVTTRDRKRVDIHEDDVGMSHGANAAFVELAGLATCSSGSVMVPCPWFPEAAEIAARDPRLDLGVHLTLTSEQKPYRWRPLTGPPRSAGMTDEQGYFWPDVPRARQAHPEAVEAELRAQIEGALAAATAPTPPAPHRGTAQRPEFPALYRRLGRESRLPVLLPASLERYNPAS